MESCNDSARAQEESVYAEKQRFFSLFHAAVSAHRGGRVRRSHRAGTRTGAASYADGAGRRVRRGGPRGARVWGAVYAAFDLLWLNGRDLRRLPPSSSFLSRRLVTRRSPRGLVGNRLSWSVYYGRDAVPIPRQRARVDPEIRAAALQKHEAHRCACGGTSRT